MKRMFALLALLGLIWSGPAAAQSFGSVLETAGFVGTWASDCQQQPTIGNGHLRFDIQSSGSARVRVQFGKGYEELVYVIREAKHLADGQLWIRTRFKNEDRELIMRITNNRLRTMSNRRADGTYVVKDGLLVSSGDDTPWLDRCR